MKEAIRRCGNKVRAARRGGHEMNRGLAVGETTLRHVIGLLAESDGIDQHAARAVKADRFAPEGEPEVCVRLDPWSVLAAFFVRPDEQETVGGDGRALGELIHERSVVGEQIGDEIAGEIDRVGVRIVEFDPVLEIAVGWIGQRAAVAGHPFVDGDIDDGAGRIVGRSGRDD